MSKNNLIDWQDALAILEETDSKGVPRPFSITFCTADETRQTGGEIIHYPRAIWHVAGGRVRSAPAADDTPPTSQKRTKRPNHAQHWTRNIRALDSDQIRKLHIHLILEINNQLVR
jgi:hypothetical protein